MVARDEQWPGGRDVLETDHVHSPVQRRPPVQRHERAYESRTHLSGAGADAATATTVMASTISDVSTIRSTSSKAKARTSMNSVASASWTTGRSPSAR